MKTPTAVSGATRPTDSAALTIKMVAATVRTDLNQYYEGFAADANALILTDEGFGSQPATIRQTFAPALFPAKLTAAATEARKEIVPFRSKSVVLGERHTSGIRAALAKSQPPENEVVRFWRHQELRDEVRELDPVLRIAYVETAGRNGDVDSIEAIAGAPKGFGLVPAEVIEKARATAAGKINPELASLAKLKRAYDSIIAAAEKGIADTLAAEGVGPANIDPGTLVTI